MVGDCGAVIVGDGQAALNVDEVADERSVEDERLRAHLVAGHAVCEGGDFGGGEGYVPDACFSYGAIVIQANGAARCADQHAVKRVLRARICCVCGNFSAVEI